MSFYLYQGNRLDALAEQLAHLINQQASPDPFAEETVVVPNQGLARWLSLQIAQANGLCPAIEFPYPGAFLYQYIFNPMMGIPNQPLGNEDDLPFAPATVRWRILVLLAELESEPAFERVRAFTGGDPFRRYQLAGRLAQLFDRYMTYRPDMLAAWEQHTNRIAGKDAAWQYSLWLALIGMDNGVTRHFSGLYQRFIRETATCKKSPAFLDPLVRKRRIFYFGASSLPPAHLDVLFRLSELKGLDLHFFAVNPCEDEWSDAKSLKAQLRDKATLVEIVGPQLAPNYEAPSNPLLGSLGRSGKEFFSLLLSYENITADRASFKLPPVSDTTALATLQRDIVTNAVPQKTAPFALRDFSITIHACHSPMREVEVLRDQLLALFKEWPDLKPREISVYTPDVQTYAPYIDAVFGRTLPSDAGHIPYTVADKSLLREYAECKAFLSLLAVAAGRFKASDVLGLLQNAPIRNRFGLAEEDVARLGALLKQAHLAWGIDAAFREEQGASKAYANTWQFALDRLILGAAMWDETDSVEPLKLAEGACIPCHAADGNASVIGRLADFFAELRDLHESCTGETTRTCAEWHAKLCASLTRFFSQDERSPYGVIFLRQTLDLFLRYTEGAACGHLEIPFAIVVAWLKEQLGGSPGNERFVTGKVTFSRFQPMRNVPSRVVCMLGMNDKDFPRNTPSLSFDLMDSRTRRKVGDLQTRDEDRYAFLETLLAARERLVVTYTGQSEKDNKPLPPSVLVCELVDAVDASFIFPAKTPAAIILTVRHPLHPFSPEYFKKEAKDPRLVSFSEAYHKVAEQLMREQKNAVPIEPLSTPAKGLAAGSANISAPRVVQLSDLIAFFRSPSKYFYNKRLGVYLDIRSGDLPEDEELLEPDTLDVYNIKSDLLKKPEVLAADPHAVANVRSRWETEGRLTVGSRKIIADAATKVRALLDTKAGLNLGARRPNETVDIPLNNGGRLQGLLDTLYEGDRQVFLRPAREKGKDIVTAWISHLAACAHDLAVTTHGVYEDNQHSYEPIGKDQALRILTNLIGYFMDESHQPFCFDPDIGGKQEKGEEVYADDWCGGDFQEGVDSYTRHAFGDTLPDPESPEWATLTQIARDLFGDLPAAPANDNAKKGKAK